LLRMPISDLEARLDPWRFARISRSTIVNVDHVEEIKAVWHGDFEVFLKDGTALRMSRRYRERVLSRGSRPGRLRLARSIRLSSRRRPSWPISIDDAVTSVKFTVKFKDEPNLARVGTLKSLSCDSFISKNIHVSGGLYIWIV